MTAAQEPLEPCPFCGSATVMHIVGEGISCRACHAQVLGAGVTGDVETWNRRAMAKPGGAEVERLREALQRLVDDILEYERINKLAPNPGRRFCWSSVEHAVAVLAAQPAATEDKP